MTGIIFSILSVLLISAHYLRGGNFAILAFWILTPGLLFLRRRWATWMFQILLLIAAVIWINAAIEIAEIRVMTGKPYFRMLIIIGSVALISTAASILLNRRKFADKWHKAGKHDLASLSAAILTAILLLIVQLKVSIPMLLLERFYPGWGWLEILIFAVYAAWITEKNLSENSAVWRKRIWLGFSIFFFAQLILGLMGFEKFLMTGKLHLPIPAMIISGPIYRGEGFFMPILFVSSIILAGPAWCSYLCYLGSWDLSASNGKRKPQNLPSWKTALRVTILVVVPVMAILLRFLGVSSLLATILGLTFGVVGAGVMIFWSRKTGVMAHCVTYCPIGLLAGIMGRVSPFRIKIDKACTDCGACSLVCRYDALSRADIQARRPGFSCTLCGDCIPQCHEDSIGYRLFNLKPRTSRILFMVIVITLHASFMAVARI
jgi:ferredoxin